MNTIINSISAFRIKAQKTMQSLLSTTLPMAELIVMLVLYYLKLPQKRHSKTTIPHLMSYQALKMLRLISWPSNGQPTSFVFPLLLVQANFKDIPARVGAFPWESVSRAGLAGTPPSPMALRAGDLHLQPLLLQLLDGVLLRLPMRQPQLLGELPLLHRQTSNLT